MANPVLGLREIRAIPVRDRLILIDDLWYSIFERGLEFHFKLGSLVRNEFLRRGYLTDEKPEEAKAP